MRPEPAPVDVEHLRAIRENVVGLMRRAAERYVRRGERVLDVAPQEHEGARRYLPEGVAVETLDLDPRAGADHVGDLCARNEHLPDGSYDHVVCTEVLEHTVQPFAAVAEIRRLLRPGGTLFLSVPFNFRIHGPLPDCWRFTEHGLRALLADFAVVELDALETPGRPLMPIHYTVVARRPA